MSKWIDRLNTVFTESTPAPTLKTIKTPEGVGSEGFEGASRSGIPANDPAAPEVLKVLRAPDVVVSGKSQPAPVPEIPPAVRLLCGLDDREIAQMVQRINVARRAGFSLDDAEQIADRLLMRDRTGLDMAACIECKRFTGRRCVAQQPVGAPHELRRCPAFKPSPQASGVPIWPAASPPTCLPATPNPPTWRTTMDRITSAAILAALESLAEQIRACEARIGYLAAHRLAPTGDDAFAEALRLLNPENAETESEELARQRARLQELIRSQRAMSAELERVRVRERLAISRQEAPRRAAARLAVLEAASKLADALAAADAVGLSICQKGGQADTITEFLGLEARHIREQVACERAGLADEGRQSPPVKPVTRPARSATTLRDALDGEPGIVG